MNERNRLVPILVADDDPDDRMLAREAFEESRLRNPVIFFEDGADLMDYLKRRGEYADRPETPKPGLILLDLNMPKLSGREALEQIKSDPELASHPVIILTTSKQEEDVLRSYQLGANSYITKPVSFEEMARVVREVGHYWIEIVELPPD
ncbi:MAG: response regulator [Ignavibacteriales bacterium]|nr:response regulator [Ignavibacteriales bacterium]